MPWIDEVAPEAANGALADVYGTIAGVAGSVANILTVQSLHPEALRDHYTLYRTLMFGTSPLSRAERESIAVVVSRENGCRY